MTSGFKKAASVTPASEVDALKAQIAALNATIAEKDIKISEVEATAKLAADSQGVPYAQSTMDEQPTGRTVKMKRATRPWEKDAAKQKMEDVEMPTFYYKIDLPPSGGTDIKINGESFYHGQVYELTPDQLRDVKDIVGKSWGHESTIRGSNENVFRRPQNRVLSGKAH